MVDRSRREALLGMMAIGATAIAAGCGGRDATFPKARPGPAIVLSHLRATRKIALTIDDGYDAETIGAYLTFAERTGLPLTFNPVGRLAHNWTPYASRFKDLIKVKQVQMGNHTFNHLVLTGLSDARVRSEIQTNEEWIEKTFGVTSRPYLRPPNGAHDARVDAIAGDLGFTRVLMWQGSFEDATPTTPARLLQAARQAIQAGAVVVGHANQPTVRDLLPQIVEMFSPHRLQPVTLDEMFGTSRRLGA